MVELIFTRAWAARSAQEGCRRQPSRLRSCWQQLLFVKNYAHASDVIQQFRMREVCKLGNVDRVGQQQIIQLIRQSREHAEVDPLAEQREVNVRNCFMRRVRPIKDRLSFSPTHALGAACHVTRSCMAPARSHFENRRASFWEWVTSDPFRSRATPPGS